MAASSSSYSSSSTFFLAKSVLLYTVVVLLFEVSSTNKRAVEGCYTSIFAFGDSLTDTGNIVLLSPSDDPPHMGLPPYGQTYFGCPTGRSSDGRLIIDFIAESVGLPLVPPNNDSKDGRRITCANVKADLGGAQAWDQMEMGPFKEPSLCHTSSAEYLEIPMTPPNGLGKDLRSINFLKGANFAVVGAPALDISFYEERGIHFPITNTNMSLRLQMDAFKELLPSLCNKSSSCNELLQRSLVLMGEFGANDYAHSLVAGASLDEVKTFVPLIIDAIASATNELIKLGASTFIIPGTLPAGCLAAYLTFFEESSKKEDYDPTTGCLIWFNKLVEDHNNLLQKELNTIRELDPHVTIVYADYYNAAMQLYRNPDKHGFTGGALTACCGGGGTYNFNSSCGTPGSNVCDDPSLYVNWDGYHFTEAAYKQIFKDLLEGHDNFPYLNKVCAQ